MKKLIVMNNGEKRVMEFEEILNQFRGIALKELLKYKNGGVITEDDLQEMDIVIFKALKTYDEYHCFSTHLTWKLKQYFTHTAVNAKRQKRDTTKVTIFNLDMEVGDGKGGEIALHEMLTDDNASFENRLMDQAFIAYIADNLDEFELKLLAVNLGSMRVVDLAEEYNTSKQNINNKNKRFKAKLLQLINDFNA